MATVTGHSSGRTCCIFLTCSSGDAGLCVDMCFPVTLSSFSSSGPSCRKSFQHQYKPTRHQAAGNPFNTSTNPLDTNYDNFIIQYSPLLSSTDVYKARLRLVFRSRCLGFLVFILMTVVGFVLSVSQPSDWLTRPLQQQGL